MAALSEADVSFAFLTCDHLAPRWNLFGNTTFSYPSPGCRPAGRRPFHQPAEYRGSVSIRDNFGSSTF
jgi:hypothetical protein